MGIPADLAAGTVVDHVGHIPLPVPDVLQILFANERKALGIAQILPQHVSGGAVRLVFYIAQHRIGGHQLVLLVAELVFPSQRNIFFSLKNRIRRQFFHDVGAIHQLLVAAAARVVKSGQSGLLHIFGKARPDHLSGVHIGVQSDDTGVFPAVGLIPQVHNTANRAVCQRVV